MAYDSTDHPSPILGDLVKHCERKKLPLVVGTDCNSHHTAWGSSDLNSRGSTLHEFILSMNHLILNEGLKPTFVTRRRSEKIDITLCNMLGAALVHDWHVSDNETLSDHKYLCYEVSVPKPSPILRRNLKKLDIPSFILKLDELKSNLPLEVNYSSEAIDEAVSQFNNTLQAAIEVACPLKPACFRQTSPWWNPELSELRKSLSQDQRNLALVNTEAYRQKRNTYFAAVRKAKRNSWRQFCTEVEDMPQTARIYKILGRFSQPLERIKTDSGTTASTTETFVTLTYGLG